MKKFIQDFLLGVCAGAAIGLGGLLNVVCNTYIPEPFGKIIGALLFPVGLTLVCFLSLALFTGKIGFVFDNKSKYWLYLLTIYIGNFVGALGLGFLTFVFVKNTSLIPKFNGICNTKIESVLSVGSCFGTLGKAALCGMLVYIAVFCYKHFKKIWAKVLGIFIAIALFVYLGFDHCIANMYYFTLGHFEQGFKYGYSLLNIGLATVGNSIGAILIHFVLRIKRKPAK